MWNCIKILKRHEIAEELHQRGIKVFSNDSVSNIQELLDRKMEGIQRLPALLFPVPNKNLADINLQKYEILNNEPVHGISHHTQKLVIHLSMVGRLKPLSTTGKGYLLLVHGWSKLLQSFHNRYHYNFCWDPGNSVCTR